MEIELAYDRNFDTLLVDSIEFMLNSLNMHADSSKEQTLSRASIVFSLLLLEAAANICIEHLELESSIHREIDRLPILGKFDFYLRTNFKNKKLGRGVRQVEWVKELKAIRDGLVHLKPHKVEWLKHSETGATAQPVKSKTLDISINPQFWDSVEAIKVARGVHGFLSYFFKEKCKYSAKKTTSLLFSEAKVPGDGNYFSICLDKKTKKDLTENNIDLSYIKVA